MNLLDDARRLAHPGIASYCDFCTGSPVSRHFEGCPLLAMPKILAVLEAVERVVSKFESQSVDDDEVMQEVKYLLATWHNVPMG